MAAISNRNNWSPSSPFASAFVATAQVKAHIATGPEKRTDMTSYRNHRDVAEVVKISTIDTIAAALGRYGLVIVIGWIGALKFANFEAHQIQPLVAHSPFMGWLYDFLPVYTFSALLGVVELAAAVLLAIKPVAPRLSIIGSLLAIVLFVSTVSFCRALAGGRLPD
jgi:hypothetical protein